ncbi:MAG: pectate lyase [Lacunisphaera sp.]
MAATLPAAPKGAFIFDSYVDKPADWFATSEAQALADKLLLFQDPSGGWPKNRIMTLTPAEEAAQRKVADDEKLPTIDNDATTSQLQFIARVHGFHPAARYQAALERGVDYLLAAQYENGGWPQFYPLRKGYYTHITFNDDAMAETWMCSATRRGTGRRSTPWMPRGANGPAARWKRASPAFCAARSASTEN